MTDPAGLKVVAEAESKGVRLRLAGGKVKAAFPASAKHEVDLLLERLRRNRDEVVEILRGRSEIPSMPAGVRLVCWNLEKPPVAIERCSVVNDPALFARRTLEQLQVALEGKNCLAGNWSIRELVDRLEQVGVVVELVD